MRVWEPFPHLKSENGSECGIGMDCHVLCDFSTATYKDGMTQNKVYVFKWSNH